MQYFVVPTVTDVEGFPSVTLEAPYKVVLWPRENRWWVIGVNDLDLAPPGPPLPLSLGNLLDSADAYPPALSLTQDAISAREWQPAEALRVAEELLRGHLNDEGTAPYFLAETVASTTAHFPNGIHCWILGLAPPAYSDNEFHVMARCPNGQIYPAPARFWQLDPAQLASRFGP